MNKLKKLNIKLHIATEAEYKKARADFIANYTKYERGGFLSIGQEIPDPQTGEAKWNSSYPEGFDSWQPYKGDKLTTTGQQKIIDKINEVITYLNDIEQQYDQKKGG